MLFDVKSDPLEKRNLADEIGIDFTLQNNERLKGVSQIRRCFCWVLRGLV